MAIVAITLLPEFRTITSLTMFDLVLVTLGGNTIGGVNTTGA